MGPNKDVKLQLSRHQDISWCSLVAIKTLMAKCQPGGAVNANPLPKNSGAKDNSFVVVCVCVNIKAGKIQKMEFKAILENKH